MRIYLRRGTSAQWAAANPVLGSGEPGVDTTTGDYKIGDGVTAWTTLPYRYVSPTMTQVAEGTALTAFQIQPFTAGTEPFQLVGQSFANTGAGAGTRNHAMYFGFNAGRHTGDTGVIDNKPAIIMGFEDNYYDDGGDAHWGVEWYIEYWSPDGTSQQMFRPFYTRVYSDSNATQDAVVLARIGSGAVGQFSVRDAAEANLFTVKNAGITLSKPTTFLDANPVLIRTTTGQATLVIDSFASGAALVFQNVSAASWILAGSSTTQFTIYDKDARQMVVLSYGATAAASTTTFNSTVVAGAALTAPQIIGSTGANKDLYMRSNNSAGQIIIQNSAGSATNLAIDDSGNMALRDGMTFNQFGATGTKIGGGSTQKFGFYGATPVARPTGVAVTAGGIHAALVTLGLIAA